MCRIAAVVQKNVARSVRKHCHHFPVPDERVVKVDARAAVCAPGERRAFDADGVVVGAGVNSAFFELDAQNKFERSHVNFVGKLGVQKCRVVFDVQNVVCPAARGSQTVHRVGCCSEADVDVVQNARNVQEHDVAGSDALVLFEGIAEFQIVQSALAAEHHIVGFDGFQNQFAFGDFEAAFRKSEGNFVFVGNKSFDGAVFHEVNVQRPVFKGHGNGENRRAIGACVLIVVNAGNGDFHAAFLKEVRYARFRAGD